MENQVISALGPQNGSFLRILLSVYLKKKKNGVIQESEPWCRKTYVQFLILYWVTSGKMRLLRGPASAFVLRGDVTAARLARNSLALRRLWVVA